MGPLAVSNLARAHAAPLAFLALAGLTLIVSACRSADDTALARPPVSVEANPNTYRTCAAATFQPPANMKLVDLQLSNLGSGVLGHHDVYEDASRKLEAYVGPDVLESYEDLDFETTTQRIAGTDVHLSAAGAFGTDDRLLLLTWTQPDVDDICAPRSIVGTNVERSVLIEVARQSLEGP